LSSLPRNPSILQVTPLAPDRIKKLAESFGSETKVMEVIKEFTDLPSYVSTLT
jgi:hypothetical protein